MYLLWKEKNMSPSEYKALGIGERIIISAFMEQYMAEEKEKNKQIEDAMK